MQAKSIFIALTLFFVCGLGIASAHLEADNYTQILLHFDGGQGSTTFTDETGRAWSSVGNAAQSNATVYDNSTSALLVNSTDYQYVRTTNTTGLNITNQDFTIEFYAKRNSINSWQRIFGDMKEDLSLNNASIDVQFLNTNEMRLSIGNGTAYKAVISNSAVTDTNWHKYVLQRKGRYLVMWKDDAFWGLKEIGADFSALNSSTQYAIGCSGTTEWLFFNGSIDEFRFSSTARVTEDWMDFYAYGDSNTDAVAAGLNPNDGSLCYIFKTGSVLSMTADHAIGGYGQKSAWGLENIEKYYPYPKNFVIMFGSNDMHSTDSASSAAQNVKDIYNYTTSHGSNTIICVPLMAVDGENNYAIAHQQQWLLDFEDNITGYPYILAYDSSDSIPGNGYPDAINASLFVQDGIHINKEGHEALGLQIANYYLSTQSPSEPSSPSEPGNDQTAVKNDVVTMWGTIISVVGVVIALSIFSTITAMLKGKMDYRIGFSILSLGGAVVIIIGMITYMLSVILQV